MPHWIDTQIATVKQEISKVGKYDAYIDYWRKRLTREHLERQTRSEELREAAARCARFLASHYGVKRVYLFGSLVWDTSAHERSDIDLAVEALPSEVYFAALSNLWELVPTGVEVDLVPLEDATKGLRKRILEEGHLLYDGQ